MQHAGIKEVEFFTPHNGANNQKNLLSNRRGFPIVRINAPFLV
jgi:hypothetical protein